MNKGAVQFLGLVMAGLFLGTLGTPMASALPQQVPLDVLHEVVMNDDHSIANMTKSFPNLNGVTPPTVAGYHSLHGFRNETISRNGASVTVYRGKLNGTRVMGISYSEVEKGYTVVIADVVSQSEPHHDNFSQLAAVLYPAGKNLGVGDAYVMNYSSSLQRQYGGLANGLDIMAQRYAGSQNKTLQQLAVYDQDLARSFSRLESMLPNAVLETHVVSTIGLVADDNCVTNTTIVCYEVLIVSTIATCIFAEIPILGLICAGLIIVDVVFSDLICDEVTQYTCS